MRQPFSYIFAILLLQLSAAIAFDMQSVLSAIAWSMSRIPGFILDLNHPWINEHRASIELLTDPTEALCSLDSTMRNGPHKHQYPADLYKYLEIDNNKAGVDRRGWSNAISRLQEMLACPAALNDVEHLKVSIYAHHGPYVQGIPESPTPPQQLLELFVQALTAMPNLRKIEWETFGKGIEEFKQAFADAKLTLPSVRSLWLGSLCDFLVDACLNTEELRSGGSIGSSYFRSSADADPSAQLIDATRKLKNLTTFGMQGEWSIRNLKALIKNAPGLKKLSVGGEIASRYGGSRDGKEGSVFKQYLDVTSKFKNLESLTLPGAAWLGFGFDGGPWCGNAYMGPHGRRLRRQVATQDAETTELAGTLVLTNLPKLKELQIGSHCVNVSRSELGTITAEWEWSSKGAKQWFLDMYPGTEDKDDDIGDDDDVDEDAEDEELESV